MFKFITYSRKSRHAQDGHTQHTHATSEWHINNYLKQLDAMKIPYEIVESYEENISGGGYYTKRPIFRSIVKKCQKDKSLTLLVAKADRMSRNMRTGAELMETINFVLANAPDADDMQKHLEFMIAEREWKNTSQRFKDMYEAKKARCEREGQSFVWGGNSEKWKESYNSGKMNHVAKSRHVKAQADWESKRPQIEGVLNIMKANKIKLTHKNIADNLSAAKVETASGKFNWSSSQADRALQALNISR